MLNKLIRIKNIIIAFFLALFIVFWTLTLVLGNTNLDKVILLVLAWVIPIIVYIGVRVMYKSAVATTSLKEMRIIIWVSLIGATIFWGTMIFEYITNFPNGLTIGFCVSEAFISATLDGSKKLIEKEPKE